MNSVAQPLVSICIVAYNHEKYISQCLESVLQQEVDFDFEIIISDDASTDKTSKIISDIARNNPETIKHIQHNKNIGFCKNYIFTHSTAQGKYIAHLDGDDYWLPRKLKIQIDFLEKHPECSAVYSNALVIDQSDNLIGHFNGKIPEVFDRNFLLEKGNFLNASSLIYRSRIRDDILPFNSDFIDYKIHLRCATHGDLGYISDSLVSYRLHSAGIASKFNKIILTLYWDAIFEAYEIDHASLASQHAIIDFIGTAYCRSIIENNPKIIRQWLNIANKKTKISSPRLALAGLTKACGKIIKSIKNRFLKKNKWQIIFANR